MNRKRETLLGILFTFAAGSLLHFAYAWSDEALLFALLTPVNESPWEHLKLLFTPMLLFGIWEYASYGREQKNFIPATVFSMYLGMGVILTAFYTYSGILGRNTLPADIFVFFLGIVTAYFWRLRAFWKNRFSSVGMQRIGIFLLALLFTAFFLFTFLPPGLPLFQSPE